MVMTSDGTALHTGYDANGNMKGMKQWGMKFNTSTAIDQMSYEYVQNSNKLLSVTEAVPTTKNKLGDFTDDNPGNDYGYDKNGNMTTDLNKHIGTTSSQTGNSPTTAGAIEYNHLNLPWKINVAGKGAITSTYDATGNKLSKSVHENGITEDKITDYVGGMVYEQNLLQFVPHEEGRTRLTNKEGVVTQNYDYFIKDHLGNVRMVLTDEIETAMYPAATMETDQAEFEEQLYDLNNTRAALPPGYPNNTPESNLNYPNSNLNQSVAQLSGDGTDRKIGPSMALKVIAGDKFNARVSDWYRTNSVNPTVPIGSILTDIGTAIAFGLGSMPGTKVTATDLSNSGLLASGAETIKNKQNAEALTTRPKAFLNWVLYDDQFHYVDGGVKQVALEATFYHNTSSAKVDNNLMFSEIAISKSGYLYVFVSNETPNIKMYFDNLQVTHVKGPLLEETHYYPFGLTMAGISSKAAGKTENKYKFNKGTELENREFFDGSGLELYSTNYRNLDPQIGRFLQVDPLSNLAFHHSTYAYASNNPLLLNDPFGLLSSRENPEVLAEVVVTPANNRNQSFGWFGWSDTTNLNFNRSLNNYSQRREAGVATVRQNDSKWYKADVQQYKMETWHQNRMTARQFERDFYFTFFSAFALPFLAPEIAAAAPELILAKATISATAQGVINGPSNINLLGVGADALLPFGSGALVNGAASWRPFSNDPNGTFSVVGYNKSLTQAGVDLGASLIGGGIGARLGTSLPSLNGTLEKNVVEFGIGAPTVFTQEIGNLLINQKLSTQK